MGFFSQLITSAIGGAIGGSFVVIGVNMQFRRQSEAACRALLIEVRANYDALAEMIKRPSNSEWAAGQPNPGWLSRSVWDAQLQNIVQLLDSRILEFVARAYATLDPIPEMRMTNFAGYGIPYAHGGWIDQQILRAYEAFRPARDYLGDFVSNQDSWRRFLPVWIMKR